MSELPPLRVLIADDDDVDREHLRRLLSRAHRGIECVEAGSGHETLRLVQEESFDLVFLDYFLGDKMGTELVTDIQDAQDHPCAVVMVTNHNSERTAVEAIRTGAYDYVAKQELHQDFVNHAIDGSQRWADMQLELQRAQQRLERLSLFDSLTGLPNRNLFFDRLEQAISRAERDRGMFAVVMADLDLFKEVNDSYGHQVGDKLLAEVGRRLRLTCRAEDTFARLGGDEFASILLDARNHKDALAATRRIVAAISEPTVIEGHMVEVGCSLGIALYPLHGRTVNELVSNADAAMYEAKRSGQKTVFAGTGVAIQRAAIIQRELLELNAHPSRAALHYQPKVDLLGGEVLGMEALLRWSSPELGEVPATEVVATAERCGHIRQLSQQVLVHALDQAKAWRSDGRIWQVSVNLSVQALDDPNLARTLSDLLTERELPAQSLTLELSEAALLPALERARSTLKDLEELGVRVAIDHFGAGYSSLTDLRDMHVDELKLDPSLLPRQGSHRRNSGIVRAVCELSESLGARLVAGGIEDSETLADLVALGCRSGQGFSIAPPMPPDEVVPWCSAREAEAAAATGT